MIFIQLAIDFYTTTASSLAQLTNITTGISRIIGFSLIINVNH